MHIHKELILLSIIFIVLAFINLSNFELGKTFSIQGHYLESSSMEPKYLKGDFVVSSRNIKPEVGDIIVYTNPLDKNQIITHRVISSFIDGKTYYYTKGDANLDEDPWQVREDFVIGKVVFSIPYIGFVFMFLKSFYGIIFCLLVALAILILDYLKKEGSIKYLFNLLRK